MLFMTFKEVWVPSNYSSEQVYLNWHQICIMNFEVKKCILLHLLIFMIKLIKEIGEITNLLVFLIKIIYTKIHRVFI